jgi:hypothetical protein
MLAPIERYVLQGIIPGGFLQAVICNDLAGAMQQADDENLANIQAFAAYFYNNTPGACWGSREKMVLWGKQGGEVGRYNLHKEKRHEENLP